MVSSEAVIERWLQEPVETMFAVWPEHEIRRDFRGYGVGPSTALFEVNPLRADAQHEFRFSRQRPPLLEKQVGIPFRGSTGEEGRNACFEFEPVFYRLDLHREIRRVRGGAPADIPVDRARQFEGRFILFLAGGRFDLGGRPLRRISGK